MEQPPGSLDDLQPQDLSTSSAVIDLTRKETLKASSLDGPHPNTGTSNSSGTTSSAASLQSGDQIEPHDAFNHTPAPPSQVLSHHAPSPLYAVPPVDKFSLHTPCEAERGLRGTGYAPHQRYRERVPTQTERLHTVSRVVPVRDRLCPQHQVNGFPNDGDLVGGVLPRGDTEPSGGVENGCGDHWLTSGVCAESPVSGVVCLTSENQGAVVEVGARELCPPSREYKSPLEDPISPSATSVDGGDGVFIMPQASSSPSGDKLLLDRADEGVWDDSSIEGANQLRSGISDTPPRSDSADDEGGPVRRRSTVLEPRIDLTDDVCLSHISEDKRPAEVPHVNGDSETLQRCLQEKKLPVRSGRGVRLEAIVMNINSSRYKVSGCIRARRNTKTPQRTSSRTTVSPAEETERTGTPLKGSATSTSDSHITSSATPPQRPPLTADKTSKKKSEEGRSPAKSKRKPPPAQCSPPKKSPAAAGRKPPGGTPRRRRRRKVVVRQSSAPFAPNEPEIKLKYVTYKEERRDVRSDPFSPFVHVERQQSSPALCTVVNYPEVRKGQQPQSPSSGFLSAAVPSTSCLRLGRGSRHSQQRRALVCCLCGLSANAMDLGDLHGPYYPEGYQLSTKTPACRSGVQREGGDSSDSDSSSCSVRGRGRKTSAAFPPSAVVSPTAHLRPPAQLKKTHQWAEATRPRAAGWPDVEDWYSPPVLPQEPCEYWLHEDCGIWSAGVFLVKGRVYGLEEACRVAQETVGLVWETVYECLSGGGTCTVGVRPFSADRVGDSC